MKTPRQILLEQNQSADSRLKTIQRHVIANSFQNRAQRLECGCPLPLLV